MRSADAPIRAPRSIPLLRSFEGVLSELKHRRDQLDVLLSPARQLPDWRCPCPLLEGDASLLSQLTSQERVLADLFERLATSVRAHVVQAT
jgi:hypothetical protein